MGKNNDTIDLKVINNIKALGIDMINTASSGHPGIVLGAAPIIYRLYNKHLNIDVNNSDFINRDRFVMSAGHGSALLYATLFMSGFPISIDDLKNFRKYDSITPGHPEVGTFGVDVSTGPLGQGFATGVGMAIAEAYLNAKFKYLKQSLIDHYTYVFVSDGDLMEGISYEAGAIAGNFKLGKLIVLYDSNNISLDGSTKNTFSEDVLKRFESLGWDTHFVSDPYDFLSFDQSIEKAKQVTDKPSIIEIKTIIGKGSKNQNTNIVHGKPLDRDDITKLKKKLGIRDVEYTVLSDAYNYMKDTIKERSSVYISKYKKTSDRLKKKLSKELVNDFNKLVKKDNRIDIKSIISSLDIKAFDTGREMSHKILNKIDDDLLLVGTDTWSSTLVCYDNEKDFSYKNRKGRNVPCGVRELAGSAICNGLSLMGLRGVVSTFLSFSNYMIPSIRMSSLMGLNPIYIFTHDTVLVGEDGPSHQPIEQMDMLRLIPNVVLFRPCDKNEIIGTYKYALLSKRTCVIVLSKNKLKSIKGTSVKVADGAYSVKKSDDDEVCIVASGSEVLLALSVSEILEKHMIKSRVVSMPSVSLFNELDRFEQEKILPNNMKKVVIELSSCSSYYKFLSREDLVFNVKEYQKSGNERDIIDALSYTASDITKEILDSFK